MKILYWSPIHGQAGTTSNIIVTALIAALKFHQKIVLTQTHFNYNNLEAPFIGVNVDNYASKNYYMDVGLDSIIRCFKAARVDKVILENCCPTIPSTNLMLLPGTTQNNRETFENEMDAVMINLLHNLEELCEAVFVDISAGDNHLSKKLMAVADLTVINLSQNIGITDMYFKNFKDLIPGKKFYLFGNYDNRSKYNINNIRKLYRKDITKTNSGVIPYNTSFLDAQCDGEVVNYIRNNLRCRKDDENYFFVQKAIKAAEKILKSAGVRIETEERM